jgi:hypothetical protein
MTRLICPHCNKTGLSVLQKIQLTNRWSVACTSCGKGIVVSKASWAAYVPVMLLLSFSGYFSSYLIKLAIWTTAAVALVLLFVYWVPLEPREHIDEKPKLQKGKVFWIFSVLAIALAPFQVNFFPSHEVIILGLTIAAIVTVPLTRDFWRQDPKADERVIAHGAGYALGVIFHFFVFGIAFPAYPASALGEEQQLVAKVIRKKHTNRILRCNNSFELSDLGSVCVGSDIWKQIKRDDTVHVIAARSWFGDYIKGVSLTESVASHGI